LKIKTKIDDILIEGEITYLNSSDVSVKITSPFTGVSKGTHIPYFARGTGLFKVNGSITSKGMDRALRLLKECYEDGSTYQQNAEEIENKIQELKIKYNKSVRAQGALIPKTYVICRKALKKSLKAGELNKTQYDIALRKLLKVKREHHSMAFKIQWSMINWFREKFGRTLAIEQVRDIFVIE